MHALRLRQLMCLNCSVLGESWLKLQDDQTLTKDIGDKNNTHIYHPELIKPASAPNFKIIDNILDLKVNTIQ